MNHNYLYGSFSRLSDFPLDDRYLFETREKLNAYLTVTGRMTTTAYEGQLVYIVDEEALCLVQKDDQGGFYPQTITSEAYDDADIRNEIDKIKDFIQNGKYNVIEENGAVAYGVCTIAKDHQFTVGEYNDYDSNAIFTVGNGIEGNRNNAFTVNRDGTATVSEPPKKDQDVATKKYVDDVVANINVDTSDLISKSELDEAIKDFITIDDIPPQQDIDASNLVTKTELEEAIAGISGSEVTAAEFKELSDKVTNLNETINSVDDYVNDTIVPALNTQSERIVNLDERLVELENATPEIPENIVDEDKLNETLKDYATKSDLVGYIEKALVDSVNLETGKVVINGVEADPLPNIIYLWKDPEATLPDIYNEYTLIGNELILIGDTSTNLSDFYTKSDVDKALDEKAEKKHTHSMSDIADYEAPYVPTKISELTNDSNFAEKSDFNNYYTKTEIDELIEENKGNDVTIPVTPVVLDDTVTENSSNGVKSSGIYAFVKDEISKIEHPTPEAPDLSNYATTDYVKQAIAEAELNDKEVDLSSYATITYVDDKIKDIIIPDVPEKLSELENDVGYITIDDVPETDLSDYYNKKQVEDLITDATPDTSSFITMEDVENKGYLTEHQDISGKLDISTYTEDKKTFITEHQDISNLATKGEVEALSEKYADKESFEAQKKIVDKFFTGDAQEAYDELSEIGDAIVELRNQVIDGNIAGALVDRVLNIENTRYTKDETDALISNKSDNDHKHSLADITDYVAPEIPSLDGYATQNWVEEQISNIEHPTTDLSDYATTDYVKQAIAEAELNDKEVDLSSYATVSYVDGKFDSITIPDVPTKVSELENDAEYITADAVPTKISDLENDSKYITIDDIPTTDLSDYYTKTQVEGLISDSIPDTSNFITMKDVEDKGYLTEHQDISGKLDVATYTEDKKTFLVANDIKDMATKSDISNLSEVYADKKEFDSQKEIVSKFFSGNAQEAYDELSEIGDAIVELRNQVIDENIAGALVDKVIDIENTRYTKTEVDALLEGKSDVGHKHDEYLTELPEHTHDQYLTELPEHSHDEYLTELPEHTHDQYLTELPEHTHDEYLTELPEHTHSEYTTTSDVNTLIDAKLGQVSIDSIDPEKVIFPNEIKTTYSIGNITVSNGQPTTLVKAGDSLKDFFNIFMSESVGSVTAPSLSSITATGANSAYEVGATITNPVISFVFNDGEYQYGPEPTGCEVSAISATYNGVTKTLSDFTKKGTTYSATFDSVVISKEGNICKLSDLDVSYTAGSAPKSNLGNYIEASKIKAGSINNKTTNYTTGYRPIFYGTFTEVKDDNGDFIRETITTSNIRTKLPNKKNGKVDFTMTITAGETSAMIAIPSSWGSIKSIKDVDANADILNSFKTSTVEVNGYGENTNYKTNYTLYVFSTAGFGDTTYDVKF